MVGTTDYIEKTTDYRKQTTANREKTRDYNDNERKGEEEGMRDRKYRRDTAEIQEMSSLSLER